MPDPLKLMCVFSHPDDESLATGATLAKYSALGVETYLVTATRGERGWPGAPEAYPGLAALGQMRERELRAAAAVLGLREVCFLDYVDGDLDQADHAQAVSKIAGHLRRVRPQVVISFGPDGAYGHPDHIAVSQFTSAAIVCAADAAYHSGPAGAYAPHCVSKFYYLADTRTMIDTYQRLLGEITMDVDGVTRRAVIWEDWAISARIETGDYWRVALRAILCHQTQIGQYGDLAQAVDEHCAALLGTQTYYRALSLVNGGRRVERDLFEGIVLDGGR
jgi:LmbE family N-acetylglucosaminyl deacetylase